MRYLCSRFRPSAACKGDELVETHQGAMLLGRPSRFRHERSHDPSSFSSRATSQKFLRRHHLKQVQNKREHSTAFKRIINLCIGSIRRIVPCWSRADQYVAYIVIVIFTLQILFLAVSYLCAIAKNNNCITLPYGLRA
jgi:hypothetical protein